MGDTIQKRISALMLSNRKHARYVVVLACMAVAVVLGVTAVLRQQGQAKTYEVRVLNCQYSGNGAHTHDASCYDADGNLVCPLEEREYHVHDDSCYASETYLVCGLEEGAGAHAHDESCYDEEGNLVCGLEESEGHVHTDECWQTDTYLACGKDEVADEHVHGEGCFKTIVVDDGEDEPVAAEAEGAEAEATEDSAEAAEGTAEDAAEATAETKAADAAPTHPAQEFKGELKEKDENGEEHVVLTVAVKAPEGALPAGSTMKVAAVNVDELAEKTTDAIKARLGEDATVTIVDAVDIKFLDKDGNEIDPAKKVEVKITSDAVKATDEPTLVHIDKVTENGEVVNNVAKVNADEKDTSIGNEDSIKFESDKFSPYVVTEAKPGEMYEEILASMPAQSFEGETEDLTVLVEAPEGAFPEGTTMTVEAIPADDVIEQVEAAVQQEDAVVRVKQAVAVDIKFWDFEGNQVEPLLPVSVRMSAQAIRDIEEPVLVHVPDEAEAEVVADVAMTNSASETMVGDEDTFVFESDQFSPYVIVELETLTGGFVTANGDTYEVKVTYDAEAMIPAEATLEVSELAEDSEEYQQYMEQTAEAVGTAVDDLNYIKLLDIKIMNGEEEVAIQAPVDVAIKLLDKDDETASGEKTKVVHFGEDTTDVIDPNLEGETVSFETSGFSYYAVTTYGATADLAGKSYAIVQVNTQATVDASTGNNTVHAGRALTATAQSSNTQLAGLTVNVEKHASGLNITTSGTAQIVEWTFESAGGENTYYIKAPNGQYLNLSGNNALLLSDTQQALTITAGTGDNAGMVRISNGNRRVQSSVSAAADRSASNSQYFYNGNSNSVNDVYMTLCEVKEFDPNQYPAYSGEKVGATELVDGENYIIYKNIYNEVTGQYEDWVIDGNGNPVRAYDQGDSVSLHSAVSPWWKLSILKNSSGEPTGYYLFANEKTGMILHPMADGTLVKEYDPATSPTSDGVAMKGRENGEYTSTIEYWDGSAMHWYGYQFTSDGQVVLSSATGNASQALSFAGEMPSTTGLHEVDTVDSEANGITIHMFNYADRATISNVTGHDEYGVTVLPVQHVQAKLGTDGYPVFTNGNSGSTLFNPSNSNHQGTGNHLFLESIYDSTGYYEYSAFNNFARYNKNTGNFTVYEETGTPSTTSNNFYYKRGNFFPYNSLNTNNTAQNIYTGDGSIIDYENPSYGSNLYGLSGTTDFYFGMTMDFNFLMPKDGYYQGTPLIYEFNGDDDLWIYIDNVLILDIGGVHDAFPGTINFATGEIIGGNGGAGRARTIKQCFKNAGVFPDGTAWDDSKVDQYFKGETFVSYGSHKFNMFYMEHGAGASNLMTRFNLPVIERGKVVVEKQLDESTQVDYANVSFAYQMFAKNTEGKYVTLDSAVYEGKTDDSGKPVQVDFYDGVKIGGQTFNDVFYLKPTEAAVFSDMIEDENYYVQEIGVKIDYYDEVFVNDVKIDGVQVEAEPGTYIYKSSEATARNRARVTFTNHVDVDNSNELLITKRLANGTSDNGDTFEFRVMLENSAGNLAAYYQGTYYVRDDNGVYYRYENNAWVSNGQTPYAFAAGNYGTIAHIPANFTVVIKGLIAGTDFYVDEIRVRPNGSSSEVLIGNTDWTLVSTDTANNDAAEIKNVSVYDYATGGTKTVNALGCIALEKDAQVTFTNKRAKVEVELEKVEEDGKTHLSGSTFKLENYDGKSWKTYQDEITPGAEASGATPAVANPVNLGELAIGRYRITETHAPDGYVVITKNIYFEIYRDTTNNKTKARFTDADGNALSDAAIEELADTAVLSSTTSGKDSVWTITVINTPGKALPMTGGPGTTLFTITGALVCLTAAVTYGFTSRRRRERRSFI